MPSGWLDVRDFGAAGDGTTDDTVALNDMCSAARAMRGTGNGVAVAYLPTGVYRISAPVNVANVFLKGDGLGATKLQVSHDWATSPNGSWALDQQPSSAGVGVPAPDAQHVGSSPLQGTWIEDLWLSGPGPVARGQLGAKLSGVRVGGGAGYARLRIDGFFAGAFLFSDHEKLYGPGSQGGNYYGVYRGEPSQSGGDQVLRDLQLDGAAWASIGISSRTAFGNVLIERVHLGSAPFGIYKEEAAGGPMLANCTLTTVAFESCGNANIFVNGAPGSGADLTGNTFNNVQSTNAIDAGTFQPLSTVDYLGRPIGRTNAVIDLGSGQWRDNEVLASDPAYPHPQLTGYRAMIACGVFTRGRYGPGEAAIGRAVSDGKRFVLGGCAGDATIMCRGTMCRLLRAADTGELPGDLVEAAGGFGPGCQRSTGTRRPVGVAMHAANNGDSVPVAYSGLVNVHSAANPIQPNDPIKPDPANIGCVITAAPGDQNIVGVAITAADLTRGRVQALLQGL